MNGILFKPWNHKLIRENPDREWVTRRVNGLKEINQEPDKWSLGGWDNGYKAFVFYSQPIGAEKRIIKPRYQVGEVVYIKEALFRHLYLNEAGYKLDRSPVFVNQTIGDMLKWRWQKDILTGMFMPQAAARSFIKITDVRAERLQLPLSPEELELEGGELALPMLELINGKWVCRYKFKLVPHGEDRK